MSQTPFDPAFTFDRFPATAGAVVYVLLLAVTLAGGIPTWWVVLAGIPVGLAVGAATPRYGEAMNNGLVAPFVGAIVLVVGAFAYGSYVSYRLGWGLDSLLAAIVGTRVLVVVLAVAPLHVVESAFFAIVGRGLRSSVVRRLTDES